MFRKILCATDFSPDSERALRVAIRLAGDSGAGLVIAHASYVPPLALSSETPLPLNLVEDIRAESERALAQARDHAVELGAKQVSTLFLDGVPWERLCSAVNDDPAIDLIVMGTHGRTGFRRILLGSVAATVIRHSPCSVLAVRGDRDGLHGFRHVLCPVDFSPSARYAAELAAQLAVPDGEGVTLFHAIDVPVRFSGELADDLVSAVDRRAAELLTGLSNELRTRTKAPVHVVSHVGSPGAQALTLLDSDRSYDLAVVGSHGRTGISRVLLGSVAEKIVRHAPCPVLVARKRAT